MDEGIEGVQAPLWGPQPAQDAELEAVAAAILRQDLDGARFAGAIRRSIDMLLDGQHTGRFRWDQLYKTEKAHAGTLIEINLQREFGFGDGLEMDYRIAGIDVDCKFSQTRGAWMIPPEARGHLLLVVWANDAESLWCAGLVRADPGVLNTGGNRDAKTTLAKAGRAAIRWLFYDAPLKANMLLQLSPEDAGAVFGQRSGQGRVDELFLRAQGKLVSRTVVATVAMQEDYMKRVRYNGGSRSRLQPRGIVILGHYRSHGDVARRLGLPIPQAGDSVSVRLARSRLHHGDAPSIELGGEQWTRALPSDPEETVPKLPEI
ncbi:MULTISPECIES: NaeI family type II restriction endonuclease [unclassified Streptomyces]|uniref:NaeI family type II restriction endonuclease n=1 Tax=unclassified Streptomyces TaxID=2593676 RepID=UPI002E2B5E59|nr:NaeI family type II restriction endonuclease [Streptomyces sp. NBC_00223]